MSLITIEEMKEWIDQNKDDREALIEKKQYFLDRRTEIHTKIQTAGVEAREADNGWYGRLCAAKTFVGRHLSMLDNALRRLNDMNQRSVHAHFVDVCREELEPEDFQELLAIAQRRVK